MSNAEDLVLSQGTPELQETGGNEMKTTPLLNSRKLALLKKFFGQCKTCCEEKRVPTDCWCHSESRTLFLLNLDDTISSKLLKGHRPMPEFFINVDWKWFAEVQKAAYLCCYWILYMCGDMLPFLQSMLISRSHSSYLFLKGEFCYFE